MLIAVGSTNPVKINAAQIAFSRVFPEEEIIVKHESMTLQITRLDKSLPLPQYHTPGAVAFDLYARVDFIIRPKTIELIPTNLTVRIPEGYMLMVAARSSLPVKKGLMQPHGIGIIDQDYCGRDDEIHFQVYNFTDDKVQISRGERLGQAVLVKIAKVKFQEVEQTDKKSRGGFGSTG